MNGRGSKAICPTTEGRKPSSQPAAGRNHIADLFLSRRRGALGRPASISIGSRSVVKGVSHLTPLVPLASQQLFIGALPMRLRSRLLLLAFISFASLPGTATSAHTSTTGTIGTMAKAKSKLFANYARFLEAPIPVMFLFTAGGIASGFSAAVDRLNAPTGSIITSQLTTELAAHPGLVKISSYEFRLIGSMSQTRSALRQDETLRTNSGIPGAQAIQFPNPFHGQGTIFQYPSSIGMKLQF